MGDNTDYHEQKIKELHKLIDRIENDRVISRLIAIVETYLSDNAKSNLS